MVLLPFRRQPSALIKYDFRLFRGRFAFFKFGNRGDELDALPFFDYVLCRLIILIEFPVARWVPVGVFNIG
jgi:hypothetical protein